MKNAKKISLILSLVMALSSMQALAQNVQATNSDKTVVVSAENKKLEEGKVYNGFKLLKTNVNANEENEFLFQHEKSGAKLYYLDNGSEVRSFTIAFKTPIENSKGIPHILEHAFLVGGSKKYPVKQLFKELGTGMIGTSLNGFTHAESTMYPFSTVTEKDFSNMLDVYMDVIFNPLFMEDDKIIAEEGWHYSIDDKDSPIEYSGVVYNEMKGRAFNPTMIRAHEEYKLLFPDTCYSYNSGGDLNEIPKLTPQEIKDFYKKYYTGSNSHIIMVGKMDILDKLKSLDKNYLNSIEKGSENIVIKTQEPFTETATSTVEYPIAAGESVEGKTIASFNYVLPKDITIDDYSGLFLNVQALLSAPGSGFDTAMKQAGLSVAAYLNPYQKQKYITIVVNNANEDNVEQIKNYILSAIGSITSNPIDPNSMIAYLSQLELATLQSNLASDTSNSTRDLMFSTWIRDNEPLSDIDNRSVHEQFEELKEMAKTGEFQGLLKKYILDNPYNGTVILKPVPGLLEKENERVKNELQEFKDSLSDSELDELIKKSKDLKEWMATPTPENILKNLPKTDLIGMETLKLEESKLIIEDEYSVLFHPIDVDGVNRVKFYFDTNSIAQEDIPYLTLYRSLLGAMNTANLSYAQLAPMIQSYTTGYQFDYAYPSNKYTGLNPQFTITTSSMNSNSKEMFALLNELLLKTNFNDKELLRTYIGLLNQNTLNGVLGEPINIAITDNKSTLSNRDALINDVTGVDYVTFLGDLNRNFDEKYEEIVQKLESMKQIFTKYNMITSVAIKEDSYDTFKDNFLDFAGKLDGAFEFPNDYKYDLTPVAAATPLQTKQQYNVQSFNFKDQDMKYDSDMAVLSKIIESKYLWEKIRISGGAYGTGLNISGTGEVMMYSYRDSQIKNTFDAFTGIADFIRNLELTDDELDGFKKSALSGIYQPYSEYSKIDIVDSMYLNGSSNFSFDKKIKAISQTTVEKLRKYADMFEKGLAEKNITTIGNPVQIENNKDLYTEINELK